MNLILIRNKSISQLMQILFLILIVSILIINVSVIIYSALDLLSNEKNVCVCVHTCVHTPTHIHIDNLCSLSQNNIKHCPWSEYTFECIHWALLGYWSYKSNLQKMSPFWVGSILIKNVKQFYFQMTTREGWWLLGFWPTNYNPSIKKCHVSIFNAEFPF